MRILVVNDDGIKSPLLESLVKVASRYGFVYVSAPLNHQSATSHAITINNRIKVDKEQFIPNSEKTIAVDGFPADCVRVGLKVYDTDFDLVISGVNDGYNIAADANYSGTIAAAREAAILGIPGVAVSTISGYNPNLEAKIAIALDEVIGDKKYLQSILLNVNIPPVEMVKGIKYTTQGKRLNHAEFSPIADTDEYKITYSQMLYEEDQNSDTVGLDNGYIVITPLSIDQTNYEELKALLKK